MSAAATHESERAGPTFAAAAQAVSMAAAWRRLGRIFAVDPSVLGTSAHAQCPTPLELEDRWRLYFAARDARNRAHTYFVDVSKEDWSVLDIARTPILPLGEPGCFDSDGVMPSSVLRLGDEVWLYYSGWNQSVTVRYINLMGLAVSRDGGRTFTRAYRGPIVGRSKHEPILAVTPSVCHDADGVFRMAYISGERWIDVAGTPEPVYVLKTLTSHNGVDWDYPARQALPQTYEGEAFSNPSLLRVDGRYHMWFCSRDSVDYRGGSGSYRVDYGWSDDFEKWTRDDRLGLAPSGDASFDAAMTCYPYCVERGDEILMFYNGDGFGQTGVAAAVLDRKSLSAAG